MTPEEWRRIKAVAAEAWGRPQADREAVLSAACASDMALRAAVEQLLDDADAASGLFERPLVEEFPSLVPAGIAAGARVGTYRVVREIGRGGMGSVYLAERDDGEFTQRVAIKFVGGVASEALLRRFRDERQILATLAHPHIARLLDGGTTAGGLPYLVMEYVDGVPIDQYCQDHRVPLDGRLEIFRKVCSAVQYAHQRLVVHRDIKASNILVLPDGTPKLLDFGIAKIVESSREAALQQTLVRALTPESASPEQVRGDVITIAADIYALGALLYRLLTGVGPYGADAPSPAELLRRVCETTPAPPSAAGRAPGIAGTWSRDLDLIVLKALRKEPERRYGSAEQFAGDVQRLREGRPVVAAPDSRTYRLRRFWGRHRLATVATAAAVVAVLGGAAAAVYQSRVADLERTRAERRFADVRRLANSLLFEFHDAIADLPGALEARRLVVRRAAEYLDGLAAEAAGDPGLQRELAEANARLADILGGGGVANLGNLPEAEARYRAALSLREALAAHPAASSADVDELAGMHVRYSRLLLVTGDFEGAETAARAALSAVNRTTDVHQGRLATAHHQLGFVLARRGNTSDALGALAEATRLAEAQAALAPNDERESARLARIAADFGEQLAVAGRHDDASPHLRNAQQRLETLLATEPDNARYRHTLLLALAAEAQSLSTQRRYPEAIDAFRRTVELAAQMRAEDPGDANHALTLAMNRYGLATSLVYSGNVAAGLPELERAIAEGEEIVRRAPNNGFAINQLGAMRLELGETWLNHGQRPREGCHMIATGLRDWQGLADKGHLPEISRRFLPKYQALAAQCREDGR